MRSSALLAAVGLAAAQPDWGTVGNWELVVPTAGSVSPGGASWHHAATTQGCFYIGGGDTGTGNNATFQYCRSTNAWSKLPDMPAGFRAPCLFTVAGWLNMFGGENLGYSNQLLVLSTTNQTGGWGVLNLATAPAPRSGARIIVEGNVMYLYGGWDATQYYGDLWAVDFSAMLNSCNSAGVAPGAPVPCSVGWTQMLATGSPSAPAPRNSFSWNEYGYGAVLFGGFWHDISQCGPYTDCSAPNCQCTWFNDLYFFNPGPAPPNGIVPFLPNGGYWTKVPTSVMGGGPGPAGRFGHASGVIADQVYVYGGSTASGTASDMWVFNIATATWASVAQLGSLPGPLSTPAGLFIGRHMYMYSGDGVSNNLWRFLPIGNPPPAPASNSISISTAGLGAGIAIGVLINVAILAFVIMMWRNNGGGARSVRAADMGDAYAGLGTV